MSVCEVCSVIVGCAAKTFETSTLRPRGCRQPRYQLVIRAQCKRLETALLRMDGQVRVFSLHCTECVRARLEEELRRAVISTPTSSGRMYNRIQTCSFDYPTLPYPTLCPRHKQLQVPQHVEFADTPTRDLQAYKQACKQKGPWSTVHSPHAPDLGKGNLAPNSPRHRHRQRQNENRSPEPPQHLAPESSRRKPGLAWHGQIHTSRPDTPSIRDVT